MITVTGTITYTSDFEFKMNITEEGWDLISVANQNLVIMAYAEEEDIISNVEVKEIEVWDVNEINSTT